MRMWDGRGLTITRGYSIRIGADIVYPRRVDLTAPYPVWFEEGVYGVRLV